jgi:hypothetical protein
MSVNQLKKEIKLSVCKSDPFNLTDVDTDEVSFLLSNFGQNTTSGIVLIHLENCFAI